MNSTIIDPLHNLDTPEHAHADNFFNVYPGISTVLPWPDKFGKPKILFQSVR